MKRLSPVVSDHRQLIKLNLNPDIESF